MPSMNPQTDLEAMFAPSALENPYPAYATARKHGQLVQMPEWNSAFAFGWEAVQALFKHPSASSHNAAMPPEWFGTRLLQPMMLFHDGMSHARLRGLVSQAFTPKAVSETKQTIAVLCKQLLESHATTGGDFLSNVAIPLPMLVIAKLLGLEDVDKTAFRTWADALVVLLDGSDINQSDPVALEQQIGEMLDYFDHTAEILKMQHAPGVLGAMARAEADGQRLSRAELLSNAALLLAAGFETTTNLIAGALLEFSEHPDQWQHLQQNPELVPNATEECLRLVTPVQITSRRMGADVVWNGQNLPAGTHVSLMLGAANRDPEKFGDPDKFELTRSNASQHVSFASGAHYCLGAPLARLEMQVFLEVLLQHFPDFVVPDQSLEYRPNFSIRGLKAFMVNL
jgi:cytochrome P450